MTTTDVAANTGAHRATPPTALRRSLSLSDLLVYGLVYMVPIAPFAIFGTVYAVSGGMVALAYAAGMVIMFLVANSYAQAVKAFPLAGGVYSYASRGIAAPVGFLAGWALLLDYVLVPCVLYVVAAAAMHSAVPAVATPVWLVAFVAANTLINCRGIRLTARMTKLFIAGELVVLALFLGYGIWAIASGKGSTGWSLTPLFNAATFSWPLLAAAVSIAFLSFLGFDAISNLAEENTGGARQIGKAMIVALGLAGLLFIAQTWVASLLVPDPQALITNGDLDGTAFYNAAGVAGGPWLATLAAVATALAWGVANALVAQVSTSRLLYAMGRDRQLPGWLARVSPRHAVPTNAILTVAVVTLALGLYMASRADGLTVLTSLINFGAVLGFITLHAAVITHYLRRGRPRLISQLVAPGVGLLLLVAVAWHANYLAQRIGLAWLAVGGLVLAVMYTFGRRPSLPTLDPQ